MSNIRKEGTARRLAGTASVLAIVLAGAAQAQDASTRNSVEKITVTAQYKTQDIQSTPLAITAVTSQDLDNRGVEDLSQLSTEVPALNLTAEPAAFGTGVRAYIRGIGQYDTAFASEPGVGMYIDDVYYGTLTGTNFELLDLNRVEVLKGPQGVLGGKNNIGGAIRMISQKPTDDNSGYLEATYGQFADIRVKGAVNLTVIPDHLFLRVSAVSHHQDGYVNQIDYACAFGSGTGPTGGGNLPINTQNPNCKIGTEGGSDVTAARLAVRAVLPMDIEDNFAVDIIRDNSENAPTVLYAADPMNANPATYVPPAGNPDPTYPNYYDNEPVYFNKGNGVQTVTRAQFFGYNSFGQVNNTSGIPGWNSGVNVPMYGIPWDQRFIPNDVYKTTYETYRNQIGTPYTSGALFHSWGLSNLIDWDILDNVHFRSITGYRYYNSANSDDSDGSPMSYQLTTSYPTNREFQQEERFTGQLFDGHLEWTAGFFYYDRTNHQHGPVTIDADYFAPPPATAHFLVFEQNDTYTTVNKSGYINLIYHLLDNLELFGGARYTKESKTYYFDHSGIVPGYPDGGFFRSTVDPALDCNIFAGHLCDHSINPPLLPHTSRTDRPDWRAGLDYHWTPSIMTYFSFSTGYRTGGTNSRPFAPDQLDNYGPEELKSYEIGAKTDWFDHRLRANVALYMADYTHTITPISETDLSLGFPLPYVKYVNLGASKNKGFEIELTAVPVQGLVINANYSYTHLRGEPVPGAPTGWLDGCSSAGFAAGLCPQVVAGTVRVGTNPILFPDQTVSLGAQYTLDLQEAGALTPRLDWNWQNVVYQDANNNPYTALPARGLLDGRLTWDAPAGGWSLALAVQNLTDKKYFLDMFDLAIFGEGSVLAQPGPPREWSITLRKAF